MFDGSLLLFIGIKSKGYDSKLFLDITRVFFVFSLWLVFDV